MILTTGINFKSDKVSFLSYLENLIELNASCLCLEIGRYFESFPEEMIALANQHDFPLLLITENVRFVDITQDLHSIIINHHHQMLRNLEKILREFHRLVLTSQGTLNVLKLLYRSTKHQIIYPLIQGQASFLPPGNVNNQKDILDFLNQRLKG
ncbi:PucR family transcriptional regulator ligand-binding domain-containing protein [Bacillus sp. CFBP9009]